LIYYFAFHGTEGRQFLINANAIFRLLNLVYY